ncbi:hypothetical protein [uncultured Campylobacter sp.]|uniref:hypothetical protein n=1 Tax=uncultured Campylobacter sp. TaxID=218934 RepID=UPI002610DABC|nr:hypothetical protein [uncultured Campylobacter sp.]
MEIDRAFLNTKFKANGPTKFNDNGLLRGAEFGMQGSAAERKILTAHEILMAHGILKFKDASAR